MRYSDTQRTLLKNSIRHNEIVSDVVALFTNPIRSEAAIIRQAQNLGYGIESTKDGITRFTEDKGTRVSKCKVEAVTKKETIIGEPRTALTVQKFITSERTNQNLSDDIIANKFTDTAKNELLSIYDEINNLFGNTKYSSLQSVTVALTHTTITLTKDPL